MRLRERDQESREGRKRETDAGQNEGMGGGMEERKVKRREPAPKGLSPPLQESNGGSPKWAFRS